jgi:hypothetical protein
VAADSGLAVAAGAGLAVAAGCGLAAGRRVATAAGVRAPTGVADGAGVAGVGLALGWGLAVRGIAGAAVAALGRGVTGSALTSGAEEGNGGGLVSATGEPMRFPKSESAAPMRKPMTSTARTAGMIGNEASPPERRLARRGGFCSICRRASSQNSPRLAGRARGFRREATGVIRVAIPIDVRTIASTACSAFALVTPLRVEQLLRLAVYEVLGTRAPQDKRERGIRATLDGLRDGSFVIDVDGKIFDCLDDVVVCAGTATLRFFSTERGRVSAR